LIEPTTSSIRFAGEEITALDRRQLRNTRRAMRMVNLRRAIHASARDAQSRSRSGCI
jgi:hypothetical protein